MLFRNTLAQSTPVLVAYAFSFVLAPIMLARLGLATFGVWAVTGALVQYAGLADLGVSGSLPRFVALYEARGDRRGVGECVAAGLLTTFALGAVAALVAVLAAPVLADRLGVLDVGDMRTVLLASAGILFSSTVAGVLASVPLGLRRMVPPSIASTLGSAVNFVVSVVALLSSRDLVVYALANLAAAVFGIALALGGVVYVWRGVPLHPPSFSRLREIVHFSVRVQLIRVAELVNQQTDKIIIATLVGPRAAGTFELANRVVLAVRQLGLLTLSAIVPTATAEIVARGQAVVREFYRRYTQRSVAIAFPLFAAACVGAPFLFVAWLGEAPKDSATVLVLLSVAFFVNITTGTAMTLAMSDGHPELAARAALLTAGLNVAATIALAPLFGLWGVLLGTFAAVTVGSVVQLMRFHRLYQLPVRDLVTSAGPPAALAVGLALPFAAAYLLGVGTPAGRPAAVLGLVLTTGLYALLYWVLASRHALLPERVSLRRSRLRPRVAA